MQNAAARSCRIGRITRVRASFTDFLLTSGSSFKFWWWRVEPCRSGTWISVWLLPAGHWGQLIRACCVPAPGSKLQVTFESVAVRLWFALPHDSGAAASVYIFKKLLQKSFCWGSCLLKYFDCISTIDCSPITWLIVTIIDCILYFVTVFSKYVLFCAEHFVSPLCRKCCTNKMYLLTSQRNHHSIFTQCKLSENI